MDKLVVSGLLIRAHAPGEQTAVSDTCAACAEQTGTCEGRRSAPGSTKKAGDLGGAPGGGPARHQPEPLPVTVADPEPRRPEPTWARVRAPGRWPAIKEGTLSRASIACMEGCGTSESERLCYEEQCERVGCYEEQCERLGCYEEQCERLGCYEEQCDRVGCYEEQCERVVCYEEQCERVGCYEEQCERVGCYEEQCERVRCYEEQNASGSVARARWVTQRAQLLTPSLQDWVPGPHDFLWVRLAVKAGGAGRAVPHSEWSTCDEIRNEHDAGQIFEAKLRRPRGVIALGMVEKVRKGKAKYRPVSDYSRPKSSGVNSGIDLEPDEFSSVKEVHQPLLLDGDSSSRARLQVAGAGSVPERHFAADASGALGFGGLRKVLLFLVSWADFACLPQFRGGEAVLGKRCWERSSRPVMPIALEHLAKMAMLIGWRCLGHVALPGESAPFIMEKVVGRKVSVVPMTHYVLVAGIKTLAQQVGLDPARYAGHSLRRGGAPAACRLDMKSLYIKLQGGYRSDCFERYCELDTVQKLILPAAMVAAAAAVTGRLDLLGNSLLQAATAARLTQIPGLATGAAVP
eukprot:gene34091-biopygen11689